MKSVIYPILASFGYPVFLHGTIDSDRPLPDTFITYQVTSSDDAFTFDNEPTHTAWSYPVCVYSSDPQTVDTLSSSLRAALKTAGFIPQGKGYDMLSTEPTHTGWICEYYYISKY